MADFGYEREVPELILGPMLRYASDTEATVWVETAEACEVEVLGFTEPTFCVSGHHYALVCIHDLEPGTENPYDVKLDGEAVWPEADSELPPPCIRTLSPESDLRVSFGSCRMAVPHEHPHTEAQDDHDEGREVDALHVLAKELVRDPRSRWPNLLLLLGDQVYVDEGSPRPANSSVRGATLKGAGRRGARLRGVHAPLPRVLDRPACPLALLDDPDRDGHR